MNLLPRSFSFFQKMEAHNVFQARKLNPFCLIIRQSIKISHQGTFSRWDGAIPHISKVREEKENQKGGPIETLPLHASIK